MATMRQWIESSDCIAVGSDTNGSGRGDGYDVCIYRSASTGRYFVCAWCVGASYVSWYVADTLADAHAVGAHGYTPGTAPGRYRYVSSPRRLAEVRRVAVTPATP